LYRSNTLRLLCPLISIASFFPDVSANHVPDRPRQPRPQLAVDRRFARLLALGLTPAEMQNIQAPFDLCPFQLAYFAAAHAPVVADHEQELLMEGKLIAQTQVVRMLGSNTM
jgi:hypothetical protein